VISRIGSLSVARLRWGRPGAITTLTGDLEILSLARGAASRPIGVHLHIRSCRHTERWWVPSLAADRLVRTTAELVLSSAAGVALPSGSSTLPQAFCRAADPQGRCSRRLSGLAINPRVLQTGGGTGRETGSGHRRLHVTKTTQARAALMPAAPISAQQFRPIACRAATIAQSTAGQSANFWIKFQPFMKKVGCCGLTPSHGRSPVHKPPGFGRLVRGGVADVGHWGPKFSSGASAGVRGTSAAQWTEQPLSFYRIKKCFRTENGFSRKSLLRRGKPEHP